ncbi:MAG: cupin domain-containing protein [Victivallales bacterium]|jgi:mannose-6-phosphate isomerase-like protein (cupin superfamily)
MIKRSSELKCEVREKMRGGNGIVMIEHFWEPGTELKAKTRLCAKLTLAPGDSIGFHKHDNEEEVYIIISGVAEAEDNGKIERLCPGDTILTGNGAGHSIKSVGTEPLEVIAIINCY